MRAQQPLLSYYSATGDPFFANVYLLLHLDGSNGATTTTDNKGHTVNFFTTGATLSTTQKKFGTTSLNLDGSTGYIVVMDSGDWEFGSGDFCIELWFYSTVASTNQWLISQFESSSGSDTNSAFFIFLNANVVLGQILTGGTTAYTVTGTTTVTQNAWHHVAMTRTGGNMRLFLDGNLEATTSVSTAVMNQSNLEINIGHRYVTSPSTHFTGYIDEIRITKGVARYTATFTPPSAAFPNS